MKILVIGSGGREHAIIRALSKSKIFAHADDIKKYLHSARGNPGIAQSAQCHPANINSPEEVLALCKKLEIDLVIVGPEEPLIVGVSDILRDNGIKVFGPGAKGAKLEGSKSFSKEFMTKYGIPTADFDICTTLNQCGEALAKRRAKLPFVIKADGLAAGKGVFLPDSFDEAYSICKDLLEGHSLGDAGNKLVIEDLVEGKELTVLAMTDGASAILLEPSQDHKRVLNGNKGPNTGGMGVYAPVKWADKELLSKIEAQVLGPTLEGLKSEGILYCGIIYMGLMIKPDGELSLLEYNSRFGDPETQTVLPIFNGDFGEAILSCCDGTLGEFAHGYSLNSLSEHFKKSSICVVLTSGGYPGFFEPGKVIEGIAEAEAIPGVEIYHAGTQADGEGNLRTAGGRVLGVTAISDSAEKACSTVYEAIGKIKFEKMHYRTDIGEQ
ncbi:MAG: phosphoribosylamine--glycine ligase [Synergistaceae bacterium]|nr:phosphoribosylamine--glycine ligase [Synergistaceae bacterium]